MFIHRALLVSLLLAHPVMAFAASFEGLVHDPQHRPLAGVVVTLKAQRSDWSQSATTDANGAFRFSAIAVGDYTVSFAYPGFEAPPQVVTVVSGAPAELHVQLQVAAVHETSTVSAETPRSATTSTLVTRDDIASTPGADRTNSLAFITGYVPGAYLAHDQLHLRGGHQVSWLIDGVAVPNTNIASTVGPQVDPKDIDYLEIQRGAYDASYGDRTYGVFNVVPRTGFERNREAEVVTNGGSFRQTNDQFSIGDHSPRVAYYGSANYNRSDLGLETPVAAVAHDRQQGWGGFGSLIFNPDANNQLRIVTSARHDQYQVPVGPDEIAANLDDAEHESDGLLTVSWVHSVTKSAILTVSPFYHYNSSDYLGGAMDLPVSSTDLRASHYGGAQVTYDVDAAAHHVQAGLYAFHQQDHETFALTSNDAGTENFTDREAPAGNAIALFIQDAVKVAPWLTVTAGLRQTHFSGIITEDATSPRVGFSLAIPSWGWVARGFYGRFYQEPPLLTVSGPLEAFVTTQNLGFIPLKGERDEEYQVGLTVPVHGWTVDGDRFQTRATNFFDHNNVGNSNIFFPLTIDGALVQGWEFTVRSPRVWRHGQFHLAYSHQVANGHGAISGGLTDFTPPEDTFPLDHDQRHTLAVGGEADWANGFFAGTTVSYGSGFPSDDGPLPGHTTIDLSVGRRFGSKATVSLNGLNITNRHLLIDNSVTFGGTHFNDPRQVYVEFRYRFHY